MFKSYQKDIQNTNEAEVKWMKPFYKLSIKEKNIYDKVKRLKQAYKTQLSQFFKGQVIKAVRELKSAFINFIEKGDLSSKFSFPVPKLIGF